ncbi:MAG TPA: Ger(x)C family spore germination protein [Clostridiaceae bacterium]|nr:Ger(x)C family spore germination protein [Clostridiaceae bacterium]
MRKKINILATELILCFLMLFMLSGCTGGREINDLEIVIGMGIDKDKDTGKILLTAQVVKEGELGKLSGSGGGGADAKAFWNVSGTGNSVFEAVRQITHKTGNRLFVSHNHAVIFGNDLATEGLQKYIDFFLRAHEMRPTAMILIAENRASDVMDAKPETEKLPAMNIAKLVKAYGFTSHFYKVNMKEFASCLMSETKSPLAPLVGVSQDKDSEDIYVSGMAVFKKDKIVGKLNEHETRGLLWVLGEVKSGVLIVSSPNKEGNAVLEILEAKSKVKPEIKEGKIVINVRINAETSLSEQTTSENLATIEAFEKMQDAQAEIIRHEIMMTFDKSKELNADIFGFGEMIRKKYGKEWKDFKDNWDEIYSTIKLNIDIDVKIQKTDLLKKPAAQKEEGK